MCGGLYREGGLFKILAQRGGLIREEGLIERGLNRAFTVLLLISGTAMHNYIEWITVVSCT